MVQRSIDIPVNHPCVQNNPSMKLLFDILTPRPHFVIIHREEYRKIHATVDEIQNLMKLVVEFLTLKSEYDHQAILSFHQGKWYQQNHKHFHAHLCVAKKPYCHEAKHTVGHSSLSSFDYFFLFCQIDQYSSFSSTDYLNQLHRDFSLAKIKYSQYRDRCLSRAYQCFNDPVSYRVPLEQFNTSEFRLVYLASSPRIGVMAKTTHIDLEVLYYFMNDFYLSARNKLAKINPLFNNFGVHLCLYASGQKEGHGQLVERSDRVLMNDANPVKLVSLVGYIQMDEELFLRWLPAKFHRVWLNRFRNRLHLVLT